MDLRFRNLLLLLFIWLVGSSPARGQSSDYQARPAFDYAFNHMELQMQVNPEEGSVTGEVRYRIEANVDGADSLILDAAHMEIESVSVGDAGSDFHLHNDSLFIFVADSTQRGAAYSVSVTYRTTPRFGLLHSGNGTLWTSRLPLANRHWVPLPDHPRVSFTAAFSVSVPSGYRVMAPGRRTGEQVETVDRVTYRFESGSPLPAPALSWAVGRFEVSERSFGTRQALLYTEEGGAADSLQQALLDSAYQAAGDLEERTGREYPWERLHIVLLDDHQWETKTWGASTVYLYRNMGPLVHQLRRAVAAQWFGAWQREEQWADAEAINLYQAMLAGTEGERRLLEPVNRPGETAGAPDAVYGVFGPRNWNRWQRGLPGWDDGGLKQIIRETIPDVLSEGPGVYRWEDYAEQWYRSSGQPLFNPPPLEDSDTGRTATGQADENRTGAEPDSVIYRVDYRLDEADGSLRLVFSALQGMKSELTAVRGIAVGASGSRDTTEITFTGRSDSVAVSVSPTARTYYLDVSGQADLYLEQYKPASYLIYELRNAESVEQRVEAARRLGHHSDNPDLQFAIQDFMQSDPDPRVRAALMLSLASITDGAAGTEQEFLNALGSENPEIRRAALMALQNYPDNQQVRSQIERLAMRTGDLELYRNAARVLSSIGDEEQLNGFTAEVIKSDTAGRKAIFAISLLSATGATEQVVEYAEHYTVPRFSYEVRSQAIRLLSQFDWAAADWVERAKSLLEDPDPRIRYLTVQALAGFEAPAAGQLLQQHLADEYDARVRALR